MYDWGIRRCDREKGLEKRGTMLSTEMMISEIQIRPSLVW